MVAHACRLNLIIIPRVECYRGIVFINRGKHIENVKSNIFDVTIVSLFSLAFDRLRVLNYLQFLESKIANYT